MLTLNSDQIINEGIFHYHGKYIYRVGDIKPIILIRGWGGLTGIGGYHLSAEEATNVQNTFIEFLVNKLNN